MKDRISVTVPPGIIKRVKEQANKESRNFSNMVAVLLKDGLESKAKKTA